MVLVLLTPELTHGVLRTICIDFSTADIEEKILENLYRIIMSSKASDKSSELGPLPPGWDTKFDARTGR